MRRLAGLIARLIAGLIVALLLLGLAEAGLRARYGAPALPLELALVGLARIVPGDQAGQPAGIGAACLRHARDPRLDLCYPAKGDRPRLLVFGESSVRRGPGPGSDNDFPTAIARRNPDVEVLNLGSPGQNSAGVARLVAASAALAPDLILLYLGHNDFAQVVFQGGVRTPYLWQLPILSLLAQSQVYAQLRARLIPDKAPRADLHANVRLIPTDDPAATRSAPAVLARYEEALRRAARDAPAPVLISTLLRNADAPPTGVLTPSAACRRTVEAMAGGTPEERLPELEQNCGVCSASAWMRAQDALRKGRPAEAADAFAASLRLDPLPLRAPAESDAVMRAVAADEPGADLLDLAPAFGPTPRGPLFVDLLHPSVEGADRIAAAMSPAIRGTLGLAGAP